MAIITYSTNEIGKVVAERLASLGAQVVLHYAEDGRYVIDQLASDIKAMGSGVVTLTSNLDNTDGFEMLFRSLKRKADIIIVNPQDDKPGLKFLDFAAAHVADKGRIVYILPPADFEHLSLIIEDIKKMAINVSNRGITLNAVVPQNVLFKMGTENMHIADVTEFFSSDLSDLVSGQYIIINGLRP